MRILLTENEYIGDGASICKNIQHLRYPTALVRPAKLGYVHINTLALLGLVADVLREIVLLLRRVTLSQHSFF